MKVFWSWQSDQPGSISRHVVREALDQAIKALNTDPEIEEPQREITLDHDRKGVPGSPDLANVIFEKIKTSQVFVADVTPVGQTNATPPKGLINSNVAIELGYALATVTDRGLIMIMNEHYGTREQLPFDLRHKAGPVLYRLAPDASKEEIKKQKAVLVGYLKTQLRQMLASPAATNATPFQPKSAVSGNPARYFGHNGPLVSRRGMGSPGKEQQFKGPAGPLLYLRIIPTRTLPELKRADARDLIRQNNPRLEPFYYEPVSHSAESNEFGAIVFDADDSGGIVSAAQLFLNREIWAFDGHLLTPRNGKKGIPTQAVEKTFAVTLPKYLAFAQEKLGLQPPFEIEVGAYPVKGHIIYMPSDYFDQEWGPIQQDHVCWQGQLTSTDTALIDKVLLEIFEAFFDAGGVHRPVGLYSFPGATPRALPRR